MDDHADTSTTQRSLPQVLAEPAPPFPEQRQRHPGLESEVTPRPRYQAERYQPAGKLSGKVALITGGDSGIGRAVAVMFARGRRRRHCLRVLGAAGRG